MGNDVSAPAQGALPTANQPQYTMPFNQPSTFDISQNAYLNSINQQANIGGSYPTYEDWSNSQMNRLGGGQSTQGMTPPLQPPLPPLQPPLSPPPSPPPQVYGQNPGQFMNDFRAQNAGTDPFAASIGQQPQGATMPKRPTSADALQAAKAGNHVLAKQLLRQAVGLPADEEPIPSVGQQPQYTSPMNQTEQLSADWMSNPVTARAGGDMMTQMYKQSDGTYLDESGKPIDYNLYNQSGQNMSPMGQPQENFGLPQTSSPVYTPTPGQQYEDLKKQYAGINPFAASIGQPSLSPLQPPSGSLAPPESEYAPPTSSDGKWFYSSGQWRPNEQISLSPTNPEDMYQDYLARNNESRVPDGGNFREPVEGMNFGEAPIQTPEQIQQRTTEQNRKASANPQYAQNPGQFMNDFRNKFGGINPFSATLPQTTQPTDYAQNDASLPQNIQDFLKKDRAGSVYDAGSNWSYDPTTQKFNSYTMGGSQTKSLDEMQDYVNNQGKPPAIVQGALGNANTAQQPQAKPNQAFFEGPNAGQIPNGFSMINGELVNLRGAPQFTSPPQISSPLTQGTDTQLELPMQQPRGPTNVATNPLSTYATTPTSGSTPAPTLNATPGATSSGSFGQGGVLPNVTTTQQQVTAAPTFYTDYLNQLATQGGKAAEDAKYIGAQPLQEKAFDLASKNVGNYQSTLQNAINLASSVGDTSLAKAIGDVGQANISRNLAPQATAGIVGSGQFGSKRGAQALGDVIANAQLGLTAQQQQAMQQDMANRIAAAQQLGTLANTTQQLGLGDVNALSTLGQQQQTIAQNEQLFPMQQLANKSALLRGYTIPTSVSASQTGPGQQGQFQTSPLQQIMSVGTLLGALAKPGVNGTSAGGNLVGGLEDVIKKLTGKFTGSTGGNSSVSSVTGLPIGIPGGATKQTDGTYVDTGGTKYIVNDDGTITSYSPDDTFDRSDPSNYDEDITDTYPGFPE